MDISRNWQDSTYKVLSLDFSKVGEVVHEDPEKVWGDFLKNAIYESTGEKINGEGFSFFQRWLKKQELNSLVILIENYDAPLLSSRDEEDFIEQISCVESFFSFIKSNDACLRFVFISGSNPYQDFDIASELNQFTDITTVFRFSTILGFTETELEAYFAPYLNAAGEEIGLSRSELVEQLTSHYGKVVGESSQKVLCPGAVLKFLEDPVLEFGKYSSKDSEKVSVLSAYALKRRKFPF